MALFQTFKSLEYISKEKARRKRNKTIKKGSKKRKNVKKNERHLPRRPRLIKRSTDESRECCEKSKKMKLCAKLGRNIKISSGKICHNLMSIL